MAHRRKRRLIVALALASSAGKAASEPAPHVMAAAKA